MMAFGESEILFKRFIIMGCMDEEIDYGEFMLCQCVVRLEAEAGMVGYSICMVTG